MVCRLHVWRVLFALDLCAAFLATLQISKHTAGRCACSMAAQQEQPESTQRPQIRSKRSQSAAPSSTAKHKRPRPDTRKFNQVQRQQMELAQSLKAIGIQRRWQEVTKLLTEAEAAQLPLNVAICNSAISALAKSGRVTEALAMLDSFPERGLRPNVISYNAAIDACAKAGKDLQALQLLITMVQNGVSPDTISYGSAISACASQGEHRKAQALLQEMKARGVPRSAFCYSAAISACADARDWRSAMNLLLSMEDDGVEPTVVCYNAAMQACGNAGQWPGSLALLDTMRNAGLQPTVITFNTAISACGRSGRVGDAMALLRQMREAGLAPNVVSYTAAIAACKVGVDITPGERRASGFRGKRGAAAAAEASLAAAALVQDMLREGLTPNRVAFNVSLARCSWRHGIILIDAMQTAGVAPDCTSYASLARACARGRQWHKCLQALRSMRSCSEQTSEPAETVRANFKRSGVSLANSASAFTIVIGEAVTAGAWRPAVLALRHMQLGGLKPTKSMWDAAFSVCAARGPPGAREKVLRVMAQAGCPADQATLRCAVEIQLRLAALAADGLQQGS